MCFLYGRCDKLMNKSEFKLLLWCYFYRNQTQLKSKCQFLAFFDVFDKLFGTICDYGGQETTVPKIIRCRMNSFVESFSKHFVNFLYWMYSWYCLMKPFPNTDNTRRQHIIIFHIKRHYSTEKDFSTRSNFYFCYIIGWLCSYRVLTHVIW